LRLNTLVYILFLVLEKTVPIFPLSFTHFLAEIYKYIFYYFIPIRKKTAVSNLKLAFPEKDNSQIRKITIGAYRNALLVILEFFYIRKLKRRGSDLIFSISNPGIFDECLSRGKGIIIISAHFGNWELMAHGVAGFIGRPFNIIVKKQTNEKLDKEINRVRKTGGNKMVEMQSSVREVLTLLRDNKIVAIVGDQSAPKENSVKVNFFVKDVPTFEGTARFAIKTGAAVLFCLAIRNEDYSYIVDVKEINTSKYKDYNEENIRALTQEHTALLEEAIRKHPAHWLWFHRRFKHVAM
jgi:KDO2-lipid IV(A) lauroyltransferase